MIKLFHTKPKADIRMWYAGEIILQSKSIWPKIVIRLHLALHFTLSPQTHISELIQFFYFPVRIMLLPVIVGATVLYLLNWILRIALQHR